MTRTYCKLVRDGMRGVMQKDGNQGTFATLTGGPLENAIDEKVLEEAKEYLQAGSAEELADLYAIVERAARRHGGIDVIRLVAARKAQERGGFETGLFLLFAEGDELP